MLPCLRLGCSTRLVCSVRRARISFGRVLTGEAEGRRRDDEITLFDSTGLAIQDLAVAIAAYESAGELDLPQLEL